MPRGDHERSFGIVETGVMTEPSGRRKWYIAAATISVALLAFLANIDGTLGFFERLSGSENNDAASADGSGSGNTAKSPSTATLPNLGMTTAPGDGPETIQRTPVETTTAARRADTTAQPTPRITEGWFNLTAYYAVAFGNGHYSVPSIQIGAGATAYPDSIRGSYPSSESDPNNSRTWLVGGKCTRLSVWVGKDAGSTRSEGVGRFIVKAEDIEIYAVDAVMTDTPKHIEIDITGVSRLTLLDTRSSLHANNAWGSPRVHCTAPPGKSR